MQPRNPKYIFFLMFSIFLLLNLDFTILRSLRNTIAVVEMGSGARSIPLFELFGAMPGAFLMSWGLAFLMNRFSIEKVFLLALSAFLGFFLVFATLTSFSFFNVMLFYVMSELWKPALAIILFWGLVNKYIPLSDAKKLYAPLMLGGSLGSIIAGPVISLCISENWADSFNLMIAFIVLTGVITGFFYYQLWRCFAKHSDKIDNHSEAISLKEGISVCLQSQGLRLLSWIIISDYIAYSLGEVIFLDVLKIRFPKASDYCNYMGYLSLWSGVLTLISSIFLTPFILQRCRWVVASLITPICLLVTGGLFFLFLQGNAEWIGTVVLLGSIQYSVCRAAKYTFFDSSKELAFVLMPDFQRMREKLVVDGLSARLGRGGASVLSITLIKISGGVIASSLLTGVIAVGMTLSWIASTFRLGKIVDREPVGDLNVFRP